MGRAFEYRKEKKFKRWDAMSKNFTKAGREIALAIKGGGADPGSNAKLRLAIQNAKGVQMPKDRIDAAIKRGSEKDAGNYDEVLYEGYGPFGVAMLVECTTDNTTRTVSNLRLIFSRGNGELGNNNSVVFNFDHRGVFMIEKSKINLDDAELDLIDGGADDIYSDDELVYVETVFPDFGSMQKKLEELKIELKNAELRYVPLNKVSLNEEQQEKIYNLIEKLEQDEDVKNVFHNMEE
ncbi:MAG: YebC/PmpR family DNA-binding transcriptional regulator [Fimbriimonadaceae bacterium]|nr:YebC/PmpR family DNA-binding transcriptional regulator [Chitinophagales bacterium]